MKTANDLMTHNPTCFKESDELGAVTTKFLVNRFTTAPVVDAQGKAIGILTETGLMRCFLLLFSKTKQKILMKDVLNLLDPVSYVAPNDSLEKVLKSMLTSKTSRVLVLGLSQRIVGVISPKDILRFLSEDMLKINNIGEMLLKTANNVALSAAGGGGSASADEGALYRKVFESAPFMMYAVDPSGGVQLANRKMHVALGFTYPELVNRKAEQLFLEKHRQGARQSLAESQREGDTFTKLASMNKKDGTSIPVEVNTHGIFSDASKFLGSVNIVRALDQDKEVTTVMELIGIFDEQAQSQYMKKKS